MDIMFYQNTAIKLCKYKKVKKMNEVCFSEKSLFSAYRIIIINPCREIIYF